MVQACTASSCLGVPHLGDGRRAIARGGIRRSARRGSIAEGHLCSRERGYACEETCFLWRRDPFGVGLVRACVALRGRSPQGTAIGWFHVVARWRERPPPWRFLPGSHEGSRP